MGLIDVQLPKKSGWQYAPHTVQDIAEVICQRPNYFDYNQEQIYAIQVNPGEQQHTVV